MAGLQLVHRFSAVECTYLWAAELQAAAMLAAGGLAGATRVLASACGLLASNLALHPRRLRVEEESALLTSAGGSVAAAPEQHKHVQ